MSATNPQDPFTDMADDLPFDATPRTTPVDMAEAAKPRFVTSDDGMVKEPCAKCNGTGVVVFGYVHRRSGQCFACNGAGFRLFKRTAEERATARERRAERKERNQNAAVHAWCEAHPAEWAWMQKAQDAGDTFADSLVQALNKWGSLTEKQRAAAARNVEREATRQAEAAARAQAAPVVETKELEAAFQRARSAGLIRVRITMGDMVVKPASPHSVNVGALYVTEGDTYLGKVTSGRFYRVKACTPEQEARVLALLQDPKRAAEVYGQETGHCCICNRLLTDPESIARGIGPVCAERFGW